VNKQGSLFDLIEPPAPTAVAPADAHSAQPAARRTASQQEPDALFEHPQRAAHERVLPRAKFRWGTPRGHAQALAEGCAKAWWSSYGAGHLEVPLGTLAVACLLRVRDPQALLRDLDRDVTLELLTRVWSMLWLARPDLAEFARPVHDWVTDRTPSDSDLNGAHAVLHTAVRLGVFEYTDGADDPASLCHAREADVLGCLVQELRAAADKQARGEYYTPPEVCDMMARVIMPDGVEPGMSVCDPAAGTGGMARATAAWMRELGQDPASATWFLNDIDWCASGLLAVNAYIWGLGPHVLIGRADALANPDWPERAQATREGALRNHRDVVQAGMLAAACVTAERLVDQCGAQASAQDENATE
jgi:hypothetical protein